MLRVMSEATENVQASSVYEIAVIPGEGIGPEVTSVALDVLAACSETLDCQITTIVDPEATTLQEKNLVNNKARLEFLESAFEKKTPILHGPAGGRYVYQLRTEFDLYVKQTPIKPIHEISDSSIVRPEHVSDVDFLIFRDNSGGFYQGRFGENEEGTLAFQEAEYSVLQIERVIEAAIQKCLQRNRKLSVVVKPGGVPAISSLWIKCAERMVPDSIQLEFIEADNACYQVVANPKRFDVIVAPNMFGDLIGDTASVLLGSRGMSFSANYGPHGKSVFQTAHGAAWDIAGKNIANPVGHLLTLSWLIRESLGLEKVSCLIEDSLREVLKSGYRTRDIAMKESRVLGTMEFAEEIIAAILSKRADVGRES